MDTTIQPISSSQVVVTSIKPSFWGLVRGELLKVARLRQTWIILTLGALFTLLSYWPIAAVSDQPGMRHDQMAYLYALLCIPMTMMRFFAGLFLMIITAYLIGLEYQWGTIRIILARGVGRLQFLLAQLTAVLIILLLLFLSWLLLDFLVSGFALLTHRGALDMLKNAAPDFWREIGLYILTLLIGMIATALMAAAMAILGRSLTFGVCAALVWFAADNILGLTLQIIGGAIHNDTFANLPRFLLGPLLNELPAALGLVHIPGQGDLLIKPLAVDGSWALLTVLFYSVAFLLLALLSTWKRDIME